MKTANIEVTPLHPERWGNDLDVVNAARVSFSKEASWLEGNDLFQTPYGWQRWDGEKLVQVEIGDVEQALHIRDAKLINYLAKHKHHSPFNHSFIKFRVKAPIFVARQLVKHKFMPWNEVSRRYVDEEPEFYFPDYWRGKAANVKQGSSNDAVKVLCHHDPITGEPWEMHVDNSLYLYSEQCLRMYSDMLTAQICPEQARMVLPQNTMTEWYWSGTLGAFLDMLVLRLDNHTQKETRDVANLIAKHVQCVFPVSYEAYLGAKGETS